MSILIDQSQLSSGVCSSRTLVKKRHLCFCGEAVAVMSSSAVASHGRRYVGCGRMPKCKFFEWIDDEEDEKSGWLKQKERRVRCFCGDTLILRSSSTSKNPNRRFISCPNRRCKFFEWVDGKEKKISGEDAVNSSQQVLGRVREFEAQERKIDRLSVDLERLIAEVGEVDAWVGRLCAELSSVEEQFAKMEDSMKKQYKMLVMLGLILGVLIVAVLYVKM
ncbi:uncharacterized protein LOC110263658 [Arachis ipaensis]|uniref:uncharacterized protein LOC110263658 n=1 Tax=Arachis ipaensis TaxID=130454 RepID=UPI000A2B5F1C|nr:uncharacterized protein LOC110263658 [Arachis ipaensis]